MSRKIKISFAESAISDLEEICSWYTEQQVPDIGISLVNEIFNKTEGLNAFPESGRIVPEFSISSLREIIFPPFRIVYKLEDNRVMIVRVWRTERFLKIP